MRDVFIVEDEVMLQQLYADVLAMKGYEIVGVAANGEEAVARYRGFATRPDLVIMDHRMPGMGGLEAAQTIRLEDPEANIIIISADDAAVWESIRQGIPAMRKPFSISDLLTTIENSFPRDGSSEPGSGIPPIPLYFKPRSLYLADEEDGEKGIALFQALVENNYKGLVFSRRHPEALRPIHGFRDVPIIWLSTASIGDNPTISPNNVQKMLIMIGAAMAENPRTAVLVLGYEFILTNLEFDRALNLVQVLNDKVTSSKEAAVIFSMDTSVLEERSAKLMKKEFRMVP